MTHIVIGVNIIMYHVLKINTQKLNLAVKVKLAGYRIHKKFIYPEHSADNFKRRLSNQRIYSKEIIVFGRPQFRWNS